MYRKISLIVFLSVLLAAFLVGRHLYLRHSGEPLLVDRLPEADFLIRANVLDLAQETGAMLHFNKVEYRDFVSKEFLLGQAKSYGLDIQRPAYAFANENGDWGALIHVSDSSEIGAGLQRLNKVVQIEDTLLNHQKIYLWRKQKSYMTYGKNWLFVYKGSAFEKNLEYILNAEAGKIAPVWQDFLKEKNFKEKNLVIYSNSKGIMKYGIEKAMFAHNVDSVSVTLLSYVKSLKPFNFSMKKEGLTMDMNAGSTKYLNLHLNIQNFANHPEDPLYRLMDRMSKKISFPLAEFLKAWQGDISYREGGTQIIKENYIESVMDDNFEITEVVSVKETKVRGFSVALSMNQKGESLINRLLKKGILTMAEDKYRFLISPPLNMKKSGNYYVFYSGGSVPNLKQNTENGGYLSYNGTPFSFYLDSIAKDEAFGKIQFPVRRLLRRNKFF